MKKSIRRKLDARKRRTMKRIDKANWNGQSPMLACPPVQYELAEKTQAIAAGGIGVAQQMVRQLGIADSINRGCPVFKFHMPYSEADHVLNIAFNLFAGGTCLEHLELRRNDEAYLDALGAQRIPDPTTAGDFCRRFSEGQIQNLMDALQEPRLKVWQQQPDSFFDLAIIEGDGTMVETCGEKKQGIGMNYKRQWGYHPLLITLANTREVLYLENRAGNRPSHENASGYFDRSVSLCRKAGFRKIRLRGDTDFSQTKHLDRWDDDDVDFVFGMDAMPNLVDIAENLPDSAWNELKRKRKTAPKPKKTRAKRPNFKERFVVEKKYTNKILEQEFVAEFDYSPCACKHTYRMVVLRKHVKVMKGQQKLFDDSPYFFYITNLPKKVTPPKVVAESNSRCDQENIIAQGKAMGALSAPLNDLVSNWAGDAGMEPEVLAESFDQGNRKRKGSRKTSRAKAAFASHGLQYVPSECDSDPGTDSHQRPSIDLPNSDVDTVSGNPFLPARKREPTATNITNITDKSRSRSPDASVPPQLSNSKAGTNAQFHNQKPNRRNADELRCAESTTNRSLAVHLIKA